MLAPFQQVAYDQLKRLLACGYLIDFYGDAGTGKTTLLKELRKEKPGWLVHLHDVEDYFEKQPDGKGKDIWFYRYVKALLDDNAVLYIDDYDTIQRVCQAADSPAGWEMLRKALANEVLAAGKRIVFVGAPGDAHRTFTVTLPAMDIDDRRFLLTAMLGQPVAARLDFQKIGNQVQQLNGHQLRRVCTLALQEDRDIDTDLIIRLVERGSGVK